MKWTLTLGEAFGMALRALLSILLLYIVWGVVAGIGAGMIMLAIISSLPTAAGIPLLVAGILIAIFGLAMALLSSSAAIIKISVGEATRRANRRISNERWRVESRIIKVNRRNGRANPTISDRSGPLAEAARRQRRREAAQSAGNVKRWDVKR